MKAPRVKLLGGEHQRERVISPQEEALYLNVASSLLHDVSVLLFDTGMRPEECHRMRWENIAWVNGRHATVRIIFGKTKAARRTRPLTPRVRQILESRWERVGRPEEGWVWPAPTKCGHINNDSLKFQHKKALRVAKLRPFEVYAIRHTFLTRLGESGCDVWTLARIAGHSSIKMTDRYVHPSGDAVLNAISRLAGHKTGHSAENATNLPNGLIIRAALPTCLFRGLNTTRTFTPTIEASFPAALAVKVHNVRPSRGRICS